MAVARIWHSVTSAENAEQYLECLKRDMIPACQTAQGNEGLCIMRGIQGELAHFLVLSLWSSDKALLDFTGPGCHEEINPSSEERSVLIAFESTARHYEVLELSGF